MTPHNSNHAEIIITISLPVLKSKPFFSLLPLERGNEGVCENVGTRKKR